MERTSVMAMRGSSTLLPLLLGIVHTIYIYIEKAITKAMRQQHLFNHVEVSCTYEGAKTK